MKRNNKGFTLIEVLAAVTILGILSVVAAVSVTKIIEKSKKQHYTTAEEQLALAAQSYVQQNRSSLPKTIGQKTKVSLKTLVENNYIETIKDYSDNDCSLEDSYVQIFKYSQDDYSYLPYLECPVYTSEEEIEKSSPTITITMTEATNNKTPTSTIKVSDPEKLISWSYIIYKEGKEVKNSGSISLPNYDKSVEKKLKLDEYTPGKIKIVVSATNIYGITTTKTSDEVNYADELGPKCVIKDVDSTSKAWSEGPVTITIGCDDGNGVGCTKEEYTKTFKKSMANGTITIEDKAGNKTNCTVSVNIDVTKPTITVKAYKRSASGGKTGNAIKSVTADNSNDNVTLDLSTLSDTKWLNKSYAENGIYYEVTYSDAHSSVTYEAKQNSTGLLSTASNVKTLTTFDSGTATSKKKETTYSTTVDGHRIYELTATDEVNNNVKVTIIAPLDREAPTKPTITNPTNGNWTNESFKLTLKSKDTLSGIKSFQYTFNSKATTIGASSSDSTTKWIEYSNSSANQNEEKTFITTNFTKERNQNVYIRVCDNAGNCSSTSSTPIKIDKTAPTCTVSGGSTKWINASSSTKKRTVTAKCTDDDSGCATADFKYEYTSNINTTTAGAKGNNSGGSVTDNAGNTTSCAADQTVKIDLNAPTCTVSGGSTTWINASSTTKSRTIKAECSDTGGSGCTEDSFSKTYSSNINTTTAGAKGNNSGGSFSDNAGNTVNCSANQTVKIDTTAPTCTLTASSSGISFSAKSDTGGSDLKSSGINTTTTASYTSSTASLSATTFYGHVLDNAGNTGSC